MDNKQIAHKNTYKYILKTFKDVEYNLDIETNWKVTNV